MKGLSLKITSKRNQRDLQKLSIKDEKLVLSQKSEKKIPFAIDFNLFLSQIMGGHFV